MSAPDKPEPPDNWSFLQQAFALLGLGLGNAVILGVMAGLGWFVGSRLGQAPLFLFLGLGSGIVLGVLWTASKVRQYFRDGSP